MSIADYLHNKAHHICQHNPLISNDQNQKKIVTNHFTAIYT